MIYYWTLLLCTLASLICCSDVRELVLTDNDRYPMAHVNAVVYALYHIAPLRNVLFTITSPVEEEATDDLNSMQLVFARLYCGGEANLVFLLENSYLAAESFQESPLRLPQFIDPKRFFSWSLGRLSEANPAIKEMFTWELETSESFKDTEVAHSLSEQESLCFNVNFEDLQPGHDFQAHLNALVNGVETLIVHQNEQIPLQKTIIQKQRFIRLPNVLTFHFSNFNSATNLPLSETLTIEEQKFTLYSAIVSSSQPGNFLTIVREGSEWKQFESDKAPVIISFEQAQQVAGNPFMLFYSKPEFWTVEAVAEPSIDMQLNSRAMERLYSVGRTLLRSRNNTPTPPPSTTLHKSRQLRPFEFWDKKSPVNLSPHSSVNGAAWKTEPQEPRTIDFSGLLISRESKEILYEEVKAEDLEEQSEPMSTSPPSVTQPSSLLLQDSELQADIAAFNDMARSCSRTFKPPRPDNYLYGWSAPPSIARPEDIRRSHLSPIRNIQQPHKQRK